MASSKGAISVEIENGVQLRRALRRAAVDLKDLTAANRRAAQIVTRRARQTAPIGKDENGHIRETIRAGATQRLGLIRAGNAALPYAGVVHYGDRKRNIVNVTPWIINAAEQTEHQWIDIYYNELKTIIERIK